MLMKTEICLRSRSIIRSSIMARRKAGFFVRFMRYEFVRKAVRERLFGVQ